MMDDSLFKSRPASPTDVAEIHELIQYYAKAGVLLPRTEVDIFTHLAQFLVISRGQHILACGGLQPYGQRLAEVRTLMVHREHLGEGLGRIIMNGLLVNALAKGYERIFALTYAVDFFKRFGFTVVSKEEFPEKVWSVCQICPKRDACDEIAVCKQLI